MTGQQSRSPWFIVLLAPDAPWLCSRCHNVFNLLDFEGRIRFLIGLSPEGTNYLAGADVKAATPPRGANCRCCGAREPDLP